MGIYLVTLDIFDADTDSPKLMLTVACNPTEFRLIDVLPEDVQFCSAYYLSHIMDALSAALKPASSIHSGSALSLRMTLASVCQKQRMTISRVAASGGPITRCIHRIWHLQISFCLSSLRNS
jgi:hypothetical protein